jgi:type II secretory pathway component GspD/PulD (secretin)
MDIPILGALFRSTQTKEVANELFILLTPHVMRTDEDVDEMTDRIHNSTPGLKDRLKRRSILSAPVDSVQQEP